MADSSGTTALIMSGAAAKGAFEAGALQVIAEQAVPIASVMGTSAGALNGVAYAAGIRGGQERKAADRLVELWRDYATVFEGFQPNPRAMLEMRGVARMGGKVVRLIDAMLKELVAGPEKNAINLNLVVCPLIGTEDPDSRATTFERVVRFSNDDFEDAGARVRMRDAAIASAAMPAIYTPVELDFEKIGLCVDGGVVNNTPVQHAMETESRDVSRIIVLTPHPTDYNVSSPGHGLFYAFHLVNILIFERLYRDLKKAASINETLAALSGLVGKNGFTEEHFEMVRQVLGWRPLEIIQIRPPESLPGNMLSAFADAGLRAEYIQAGRAAAEAQLGVIRRAAPVALPLPLSAPGH